MFAWSKNDIEEMKLPQDWVKGVFEISVEDPLGTLMLVWVVGDAARAADDLKEEQVKSDLGNLMRLFTHNRDDSVRPKDKPTGARKVKLHKSNC